MSFHRVCCCEPGGPCVCTGCDFGTSYFAGCMGFGVNWTYDPRRSTPCQSVPGCTYNSEEPVIHEVTVALQYSFRPGTISRIASGSNCCYRRVGIADVTYSVQIVSKGQCCIAGPTCTVTRSYNGTATPAYCLTVAPYCWQGTTCNWIHSLEVCPIALGIDEFLLDLGPGDCTDAINGLDCNNLPLDRRGLLLHGGLFQWRTPYRALNTLVWPTEFTPLGWAPGCLIDAGCLCGLTSTLGPFSLWFVNPALYTDPAPCPLPAGTTFYFAHTEGDCNGVTGALGATCPGGYVIDQDCCLKEFTANANPPCYT